LDEKVCCQVNDTTFRRSYNTALFIVQCLIQKSSTVVTLRFNELVAEV